MFTRASASGTAKAATMPVRVRFTGPSTRKQRQPGSTTASAGASSAGHITLVSYGVQVTEIACPGFAEPVAATSSGGTAEPAGSRQIAYSPGKRSRSSTQRAYGLGVGFRVGGPGDADLRPAADVP